VLKLLKRNVFGPHQTLSRITQISSKSAFVQSMRDPTKLQSLKTNKQKLLAVASGQDVSWDFRGFNDTGSKLKYPGTLSGGIIENYTPPPTKNNNWLKNFQINYLNFYSIYKVNTTKNDKKFAEFNFKIFYNIFSTESNLLKWNKSSSDLCKL
jgi:hypothetical protein